MERIDLTKRTSPPKRSTQSRWKQHEAYKSRVVAIDPFLPNINVITANPSLRLTDVTTLKKVPSESTVIEARARLVNQPHCVVEWKNYGCFNYKGLLQLTDIHNSRDISRKVAEEEKWIGSFSTNKDTGVEKFLQQLWHEHSPIENSERETLMGNRLLSDGCINEILEICNSQSDRQRFVMLNNMTPGNVIDTLGIDTFHIVVNVSQRNGTTHATDVGENGSHWTYMCLPTSLEGLVYCDSLGWSLPVNISRKLKPLVNKICDQRHEQFREPQTPVMLHPHNGDIHKCTPQCYDAAPLQTCGSVCGVAALMMCVLGLNSNLWKTLTQTHTYSPADLAIFKEIRRPSIHSKQTRFVMMSWIGNRKVELLDLIPLQEPTCESRNTQVEPVQESQEEGATTNRNHAEPRSLPVEKIDTSPTVDVELSDLIPLQEPTCESSITQVELVQESQEEGATTNRNHTEPRSLPVEKIDTSPTVDVELSDLIPLQEPTCESSSTQVELVQESQEEGATTNRNHTEPRSLPVEKMDTSPTTDVEMSDEIEKKITRIANENNLSNSEKDSLRKKVLKRKLSDSNMESAKKKKITKQSDIKSFLKCKEDIPQLPKLEVDETNNFPSIYVSSNKLSFQYLSKKFYQSNGYAFGKNLERNCRRRVNPVLEEEGRAVGMKRTMSSVQTLQESKQQLQDCEMENNSHINSVLKTAEFIENNGPIVSTQRVCQFYMAEKNLVKRIPSCDMIEKLSRHMNIVQIYFNGIGYILDGKYSDLAKTVETLGFISENTAKHEFNKTVHSKLKNTYQTALSSMKDPYDRFILKGVLTQLTNPKFMARLEGKTNKNSYRNCRDTYNFHIENFRNIQQTSLVVKNNMTNVQQNALTKRIIQRRKLKELRIIYEGRGRTLKSTQFPELAAILEYCFGEEDVLQRAGGGLEADSRLNTAILYRAVDNNTIMKRARDVINALSPPGFKISLSTCYNYTENYREGSHQALQHHAGRGINANISLNAPQRTGVQQFVPNLHWSTANVNLQLDQADNNKDATLVDSKDAKSIICANIAPVQKTSRNWCRREYLDHDWDQSRTFAVTPSTHLFLETDRNMVIQGDNISIKVKRSGTAATVLNVSFFEPDTAFKSMNELCIMMVDPRLQEHFRDPSTHKLKEHFLFIVDNGPSTAPNNSIVKMCLARIFRLLKLKSICQVSFAEYHSKRNPVERVHAEENRALARHGPFQVKTDLTSLGMSRHYSCHLRFWTSVSR